MCAGDARHTAAVVARQLGIPPAHTHAELLPADKLALVKRYRSGSTETAIGSTETDTGSTETALGSTETTVGGAARGHTVVDVQRCCEGVGHAVGRWCGCGARPADIAVAHIGELPSSFLCLGRGL